MTAAALEGKIIRKKYTFNVNYNVSTQAVRRKHGQYHGGSKILKFYSSLHEKLVHNIKTNINEDGHMG